MTCHKCHWIELNRGHLDYVTCTLTIWLRLSILKAVISCLWKKVGALLCTDQSEYYRFVNVYGWFYLDFQSVYRATVKNWTFPVNPIFSSRGMTLTGYLHCFGPFSVKPRDGCVGKSHYISNWQPTIAHSEPPSSPFWCWVWTWIGYLDHVCIPKCTYIITYSQGNNSSIQFQIIINCENI